MVILGEKDFAPLLGKNLSPFVKGKIKEYAFAYAELTPAERDAVIRQIVTTLLDPFLVYSGKHRLLQWEKGWGQNLEEFGMAKKKSVAIPHYFGKYPIARLGGKWIKPKSKNFEYNMLGIILDWLFDQYARKAPAVYEFGCGTGHNLIRLRGMNPTARLWGLDWAKSSQKLLGAQAAAKKDTGLFGKRFDFFNPDKKFALEKEAVVYTVAALEQVGTGHKAFVDYLIGQKPSLCIHIEPIAELLDPNSLPDYLSIEYFKKRKYLSGFLDSLRELEKAGKVKIERAQRTHVGSLFIEGYSVVVWRPL